MTSDAEYSRVLLKAQTDPAKLTPNEKETFKTLCKEHGTDRGTAARAARDGK